MEFAKSKSGHDRNQIYLIKEKDERWIVSGSILQQHFGEGSLPVFVLRHFCKLS